MWYGSIYFGSEREKIFNSKTKFYMHVKKRLYSTHAQSFIPTGACLVPLNDCPNLVLIFDPDSRTLIPGFKVSRLKDLILGFIFAHAL